jgi:hypothetical protein
VSSDTKNPAALPISRLGLSDETVTVLWAVYRVQELQSRPTPARVRDEVGASFDAIVWAADLPPSFVRGALAVLAGHALVIAGRQEPGQSWRSYFVHARGRSFMRQVSTRGLKLPRTAPPPSVPAAVVSQVRAAERPAAKAPGSRSIAVEPPRAQAPQAAPPPQASAAPRPRAPGAPEVLRRRPAVPSARAPSSSRGGGDPSGEGGSR